MMPQPIGWNHGAEIFEDLLSRLAADADALDQRRAPPHPRVPVAGILAETDEYTTEFELLSMLGPASANGWDRGETPDRA